MLDQIQHTIESHSMFDKGMRLGIAVSGGADSMCLLHLLHRLAFQWNLHLHILHVDHGIRGEASAADADFVRQTAAEFNLPFHLHRANVPVLGGNLEQEAREVRHSFFASLIGDGILERVATGHTRSDQAETVLYRLLRGSGLTGLCGILPVTRSGLVRPMLEVTRAEVEAWMTGERLSWRTDETNLHANYARNRLRHQILPLLRSEFNPNLDEALAQLATLAADEEAYWETQVSPPTLREGAAFFQIAELTEVPTALARRKIRCAINAIKGNLKQVDYLHVDRILGMARSSNGSGRLQLPALDIFRSFEWLRLAPSGFDSGRPRNFEIPVRIPGSITLPGMAFRMNFELRDYYEDNQDHDRVKDELDWQRLSYPPQPDVAGQSGSWTGLLELRNWRPGDQYRPLGDSHEKKLKLLFQEHRIPLWERRSWPVLTDGEKILWTRQFGAASDLAPGPGTRTVVKITEGRIT